MAVSAATFKASSSPSQFNGWASYTPSSNAYDLAQQLQSGTPLPASDAGNALYFAAPAQGDASWTNSLFGSNAPNIGGNYFSDRLGAPSSNFTGGIATAGGGGATDSGGLGLQVCFRLRDKL